MKTILYYVHDPMCSWCWGFSRALTELLEKLPKEIEVQRVLGCLAPDSEVPMPQSMQVQIQNNWSRIEDTIIDVKFNFDFWTKNTARRSTFPACRAVLAAREQGIRYDLEMTRAIQRAYYQEARNPSDNAILVEIANELGLNKSKFERDLLSNKVQENLNTEILLSRKLYVESFPSLVLKIVDTTYSIVIDYNNSEVMLDKIRFNLTNN